ncbi:MAG: DUF554 domain-containing protein [Christensenellales bacterium]|jgi:uncharacterized membrane protein YqgA involved in biofilm formation
MPLTGALVNAAAILAGGSIGLLFGKRLPQSYMKPILYVLGLVIFAMGLSYVLETSQILVIIISIILGTLLGTFLRLDDRLEALAVYLQKRIHIGNGRFAEGFTTSTLLYCVGALAITGSIQGGLQDDHTLIFLKSIIDGTTAIFFASTLGVGVLFSAVPVVLYQGTIALSASALAPVLTSGVITEISATGGIALLALALNMTEIKSSKVANMLPSLFFPIAIYPLLQSIVNFF